MLRFHISLEFVQPVFYFNLISKQFSNPKHALNQINLVTSHLDGIDGSWKIIELRIDCKLSCCQFPRFVLICAESTFR